MRTTAQEILNNVSKGKDCGKVDDIAWRLLHKTLCLALSDQFDRWANAEPVEEMVNPTVNDVEKMIDSLIERRKNGEVPWYTR